MGRDNDFSIEPEPDLGALTRENKVKLSLILDESLSNSLRKLARKDNVSISTVGRRILRQYFNDER